MSLSVLLAVAFVGAALYYVCPLRFRWVLLLLLSYGFYLTCGVSALPFILITTLTTWAGALKIGRIGESGKAYLHEHKAELTAEEKKAWIATQSGVTVGSDAFFPFGDNVERARKSGVSYIVEPGGSIRDDNVIETANRYHMVMAFTGMRLFHH